MAIVQSRPDRLRSLFDSKRIDCFLVTSQPHLRYLSGFSGSNGMGLVTRDRCMLLTDSRYGVQVRNEVRGWRIVIAGGDLVEALARRGLLRRGRRVGVDAGALTLGQWLALKRSFPGVRFLPRTDCVETIAAVKDEAEIARIARAVEITDRVFVEMLALIEPGVSELDLAAELSYRQRRHGAAGDAFEPIVASGERSAMPHGRASRKKLAKGDLVVLDFGCVYEGYHSDLTRTVALGRQPARHKRMYASVLSAQERCIEVLRSGMKTKALDAIVRRHLARKGYGKYFRHSLGHGIGLQIHEHPRISSASRSQFEPGNVVTIEPGVYLPGVGGVRIEDDVVVRNGHCDVLTKSPKEFLIL